MTTLDPGARDVFTHGLDASPRSTAFLARMPAPTMTWGLEVLVHDVIAAMTTRPWSRVKLSPPSRLTSTGLEPALADAGRTLGSASWKPRRALSRRTRSWGRVGPARLGPTLPRSSSRRSEK